METQEDYNKHHIYKKLQYENITNKQKNQVETWMDLETIIQSEVNQKEKNKYPILILYVESEKTGIGNIIYNAEAETQTQKTNILTPRGNAWGRMNWETGIDIYTLLILCIK